MHEQAIEIARALPASTRLNGLREYLQHYVLRCLVLDGRLDAMAFLGGTALRILHRIARYSEDLDFSLVAPSPDTPRYVGMDGLSARLVERLRDAGYETERARLRAGRPVESVFLRFPGLPRAAGLTRDRRSLLSIKLEVDTRPPAGFVTERSLVMTHFPLVLHHHDLPSMFAGKLHAALVRSYPKGRDWYDIVWYLSRPEAVQPNLPFLVNALEQSGAEHLPLDGSNWRAKLLQRFDALSWHMLLDDLRPFIERPDDLAMLDEDAVRRLIAGD